MAAFLAAGVFFIGCDKMGKDDFMPPGQDKKADASVEFVMSGDLEPEMQSFDFYQNTNHRGKLTYYNPMCYGVPTTLVFSEFESGKNIKIDYYDTTISDWKEIENGAQTPVYEVDIIAPYIGEFRYRAKIWNSGFVEFRVQAIECGCDESFSYKPNDDGTYTFTYIRTAKSERYCVDADVVFKICSVWQL
jgi:hypothetical protein